MQKFIVTALLSLLFASVFSQGVSINNASAPADKSAVLDVASSDKGILIPRLTTNERNHIVKPATALLIFNSDVKQFQVNIGTAAQPQWQTVVSLSNQQPSKDVWQTTGNRANVDSSFIGNADNKPLQLKTNNMLRIYIDSSSTKIGIGTNAPRTSLDIAASDAIIVPVGTTAQRPPLPVVGMIRYNATVNKLEGYTTSGWVLLH